MRRGRPPSLRRTAPGSRRVGVALVVLLLAGCDTTQTPTGSVPAGTAGATLAPAATSGETGATASPGTGEPVAVSSRPTSADLIRAAVEAGTLDAPTGLLYRVYAIFGDSRLPGEYASDTWEEDSGALLLATEQLGSLPPEIASELRPFLVRPTHPESVFHDVGNGTAAAPNPRFASSVTVGSGTDAIDGAPAPVVCNPDPLSDWGYALGQANFKVWGACGDPAAEADIQQVTAMVEAFWDAESTYLSREPIPDDGSPRPDVWLNDSGGDERIDIYLVHPCITRGGPCHSVSGNTLAYAVPAAQYSAVDGVQTSSAFVVIPANALAAGTQFRSTMAHELFHVFENAMNVGGMWNGSEWHWFEEATAMWAEWKFVPSAASENVAPWFSGFQVSGEPLWSVAGTNEYQSFAWPLFMEEEAGPGAIASAWHAIEGKASHALVTDAIDGVVKFKDRFRDFAIRNWNEALGVGAPLEPLHPEPPTGAGRPKPNGDHRWADTPLHAEDPGAPGLEGEEHINGLYARYVRFTVDDDVGQVVLDLSGLQSADRYDGDALLKIKDKGWERRKLKKGTTTWCMDNPDDDIEEFVVIVSNHDKERFSVSGPWKVRSPREPCLSYKIHIKWTDVFNQIEDKFTFDGWADTLEPDISGSGAVTLSGSGTISGSRPGWAGCNAGLDFTPNGSGPAIFVASIDGDTVAISAFPDLDSTAFGVSTQPFILDRKGGTLSIRSQETVGDLCPRSWFGTITAELKLKEPLGNEEGP